MAEARDGGARARIAACGRAYVAHGIAHPALYRLMFGAALTAPQVGRPAIEKIAASKTQAVFAEALAEAVQDGALPPRLAEPREAAAATMAAWSLLHGLTMLAIDDFVGPPADIAALVDGLLGALLDGLAASVPALPANIWIAPRL